MQIINLKRLVEELQPDLIKWYGRVRYRTLSSKQIMKQLIYSMSLRCVSSIAPPQTWEHS